MNDLNFKGLSRNRISWRFSLPALSLTTLSRGGCHDENMNKYFENFSNETEISGVLSHPASFLEYNPDLVTQLLDQQ